VNGWLEGTGNLLDGHLEKGPVRQLRLRVHCRANLLTPVHISIGGQCLKKIRLTFFGGRGLKDTKWEWINKNNSFSSDRIYLYIGWMQNIKDIFELWLGTGMKLFIKHLTS
jgi:hypothetical protein